MNLVWVYYPGGINSNRKMRKAAKKRAMRIIMTMKMTKMARVPTRNDV